MKPDMMLDREALQQLPTEDLRALIWQAEWAAKAHDFQRVPAGDWWTIWLMLAGRGAGKTRTAAETLGGWAWASPGTRWLVSAPTNGDVRDICFEGESGLLNVIPPELILEHNKSLQEIRVRSRGNGADSLIKGIGAEEPNRFRGPQFHGGWLDELAAWQYAQESYDMLMFGMRLGARPRIVATTTPKPVPLIRDLVSRAGKDVVVTTASTYANLKNLAPTFRAQILQYEGTELGRQEIHAEILDPEESGIIKRSWIKMWPADKPLPAFEFVILSLDTAFTEEARDKRSGKADPTACTVWGLFREKGEARIMLLDAWDERLGLPALLDRVRQEMQASYGPTEAAMVTHTRGSKVIGKGRKPDLALIEDKGSGISLRQMITREQIPVHAYNPGRANKLERLHAVSHIFKGGIVYFPEGRQKGDDGVYKGTGKFPSWSQTLITQLCSFSGKGSTDHDDYVDSTSQAIRLLVDRGKIVIAPPREVDDVEYTPSKPRKNPYAV